MTLAGWLPLASLRHQHFGDLCLPLRPRQSPLLVHPGDPLTSAQVGKVESGAQLGAGHDRGTRRQESASVSADPGDRCAGGGQGCA